MRPNSLRTRFIIFAVIIIAPIATSSIISLIMSKKINDYYNLMLNKMSTTNQVKVNLNESFNNFNNYIQTNAVESKKVYDDDYNKAYASLNYLESNSDLQSRYILRDLQNTLESYRASADDTIRIHDGQSKIDAYYNGYLNTKEIAGYCDEFISKLSDSYVNYNNEVYSELKEKENFIYKVLVFYIIAALTAAVVYTLYFLRNISDKLRELVNTSEKVSNGDFTYYGGKNINIYELDILSEAFSTMISNIKNHIDSLKEKAELESKIRDDEMRFLKYENALKLSQLKVLQSQINPHFLFNTLNCINQTAIKENASGTESLIRSVADILRYSLSMMNRNATLEEEVNIVRQYMYIQQSRYGDRIKFKLSIDADLSDVTVPGMTLQPFVENAFIHGIEPKEDGGTINIGIYKEGSRSVVLIEDDGCGIDEETLNNITSEDNKEKHTGHTTGMGIKSVAERLELMYDDKEIFEIRSQKGIGTRIYLKIPTKESIKYAKASDS